MFWKKLSSDQSERQIQFDLECLEERQMLAGDVAVVLDSGLLTIQGDDASNRVELISDGEFITVSGQGTDLNGESETLQFFRNSVTSIDINLGDGSDRVTLVAQNNFGIGFGSSGNDDEIQSFGFQHNLLSIDTGDGNDRVTLIAENSGGIQPEMGGGVSAGFSMNMEIQTGDGNDRLLFEANNTVRSGFDSDRLDIGMGDGNDRVNFEANNTGSSAGFSIGSLDVSSNDGNDRVEFLAINSGEESTGFDIGFDFNRPPTNTTFGDFGGWFVSTGDGNDRLTVEANNDSEFTTGFNAREFGFETGAGNDRFTMAVENEGFRSTGLSADFGRINTGSGDDRITVEAANEGFSSSGIAIESQLDITADNNIETLAGDFEIFEDGRDRVDLRANNNGGIGFDFNINNDPVGVNAAGGDSSIGTLQITTGGEDDRVNISANNSASMLEGILGFSEAGFSLRQFVMNTGTDDDRVQIRANNRGGDGFRVTDYVFVGTQQGDDDVNLIAGQDFGIAIPFFNTTIDGGEAGDDRLRTNFYIPSYIHNNFEDFPIFEDEN